MKLAAVFVLGVLAVGATTAFIVTSRKSPQPRVGQGVVIEEKSASEDPERNAAAQRLASQVAALQVSVAQLNAAAAASAVTPSASAPSGEADAEPQLSLAERHAADDQRRRARMEAVEKAFRKEVVDRNWAIETRTLVEAAMQTENVGLQTRGVECRSETCRVELSNEDSPATQEGLEHLPQAVGGTLPVMQIARTDDTTGHHTILYLSRAPVVVQK